MPVCLQLQLERFAWSGMLLLVAGLAGCQQRPTGLTPVEGHLTYGGGNWPAAGTVVFQPKQGAKGLRPGMADFGTDGRFSVRTGPKVGLQPGVYSILLDCWEDPPQMSVPNSGRSWIAPEYRRGPKPEFEVTVPDGGGPLKVEFDIPARG